MSETYILDTGFFEKLAKKDENSERIWDDLSTGKKSAVLPSVIFGELAKRAIITGKESSIPELVEKISNCGTIQILEQLTKETMLKAGHIQAHYIDYVDKHKKSGKTKGKDNISMVDCIIASIALDKGYTCVTADSNFWDMKGLKCIRLK